MEFWDHLLATGVGAAIGVLAAKIWQRYLQRMVTIRWSVTHETLAGGGDDPRWGRVEIRYNGNPAGNLLQWCRVEIENESGSRDLSDVVVSLQYDQPEPEILSGGGSLEGGNQGFSWTPMFTAEVTSYFDLPVADRPPSTDIYRRRDFVIPVLNRGAKAIFLFLVRPNISNQTLRVHCDHLSVRLKHRPTRPLILGVVQTRASWTGLGVGALVAVALAMSLTNIWVAVSVALLVGWFGQLVGVAVIRGWRGLTRAIG